VVKALCYKPESREVETRWSESIFFNWPNLSGTTRPSNRNVYQKQKICFWGVESGRGVRLTTLPPSVSRLSRQCGIINISQPYRCLRPITGIDFFIIFRIGRNGMRKKCQIHKDLSKRTYDKDMNLFNWEQWILSFFDFASEREQFYVSLILCRISAVCANHRYIHIACLHYLLIISLTVYIAWEFNWARFALYLGLLFLLE
jgi:hypothetical protein